MKNIFLIFLILLSSTVCVLAQEKTVSGHVTDEQNQPLPGVNVFIKNSNTGVVTNMDGNYEITVPGNEAVLVFSFIGYLKEEVQVGNQTLVNITLIPTIEELDEVVVIGYGKVKKSDLTGAVASVTSEEVTATPSIGVGQMIQGRASGVYVTQDEGQPGGSVSVRIRGNTSISNGNEPLYVIDGIPMVGSVPLNSLNSNDIESIEVLKDASATAIYGSRAANGIVLITTKKGSANKTTFSFNSYYGIQQAWKKPETLNAKDYVLYHNEAVGNQYPPEFARFFVYFKDMNVIHRNLGQPYNGNLALTYNTPLDSFPVNTYWPDVAFQNAPIQNHQLSVSGGGENATYYLSLGYFSQEGILKGSHYDRYTLQINSNANPLKRLTIGNSFNLSYKDSRNSSSLSSTFYASPLVPVKFDNGLPGSPVGDAEKVGNISSPLRGMRNEVEDYATNLLGNLFGELELLKDLKYKLNIGAELTYEDGWSHLLPYKYFNDFGMPSTANSLNNSASTHATERYSLSYTIENTLNYNTTIADKHSVNAVIGTTAQEWRRRSLQGDQRSYSHPFYKQISDGDYTNYDVSGGFSEWSILGYLGRIIYSYDSKYLFTASYRYDGASSFTPDGRWGGFPSFSAGWNIAREKFMENQRLFNEIKLRAGYGETGNSQFADPYAWQYTFEAMNYSNGAGPIDGIAPMTPPAELIWENNIQTNVGLDLGLLQNKFILTVDVFEKESRNMLLRAPLPSQSGFPRQPWINAGSMQNKGVELNFTYKDTRGNWTWQTDFNYSRVRNKLLSLAEGLDLYIPSVEMGGEDDPYLARTQIGNPIGMYYGYVAEGIFQNQEEVDAANTAADNPDTEAKEYYQYVSTAPGDIKFKDLTGDGRVNAEDRKFIGNPHPDFFFGLNGRVGFKGVELSMFLQGVVGNDLLYAAGFDREGMRYYHNQDPEVFNNRWHPDIVDIETDEVLLPANYTNDYHYPRAIWADPNRNNRFSQRFIEDGSYLRFKNITLSYELPEKWVSFARISYARIYLSVNNALTITKYRGLDPEVGNFRGDWKAAFEPWRRNLDIGVDRGVYPISRSYTVGVNLNF